MSDYPQTGSALDLGLNKKMKKKIPNQMGLIQSQQEMGKPVGALENMVQNRGALGTVNEGSMNEDPNNLDLKKKKKAMEKQQ